LKVPRLFKSSSSPVVRNIASFVISALRRLDPNLGLDPPV